MMDGLADRYLSNFDVTMVYRTDRFSRGGDQVEMLKAGFPAVRVTEANENYTRQHQDLRTENGIKYGGRDRGRRLRLPGPGHAAEHRHHGGARLRAGPADGRGHQGRGLHRHHRDLEAGAGRGPLPPVVALDHRSAMALQPRRRAHRQAVLKGVNIDDWFFGVSAVGADGWESPVVFPGAPGRWAKDEAPKADATK